VLDVAGDWSHRRPNVRPGGWAFQYWNDYYPDVDDTAVVAMALHREDPDRHSYALQRAAEWVVGMQSQNGGWGAFDAESEHVYLNHIPFADHGALLDPSTEDLTGRGLELLGTLGYPLFVSVRSGSLMGLKPDLKAYRDAYDGGEPIEDFHFLRQIESLPPELLALLKARLPSYYLDSTREGETPYLMNHCRCGATLDDDFVSGDVGAAFWPDTPEGYGDFRLFPLPMEQPIPIVSSYMIGGGEYLDFANTWAW